MYRPAALHAILLLILSLSAVLLSFRLLHGPVESLHFDSPLNIEGIFSIVLLFLLVLHSAKHKGEATCDTPFFGRYTLAAELLLVLITLGLFWRSLSWNFLSDDYVHLSRPFNGDTIAAAFRPGGDGSFRPFGFLVLSVQSLWFGYSQFLWHFEAMVLHIVNSCLLFGLALRTYRSIWIAFYAALIFAVHGSRPETVVWASAQFDLWMTLFLLTSLWLFVEAYDRNSWICLGLSMVALALAIGSKEPAYTFIILAPLMLYSSGRSATASWKMLLPCTLVEAAIFAYRWHLFAGPGGYVNPETGSPQIMNVTLLGAAKVLLWRVWAVSFFPVNWSAEPALLTSITMMLGILTMIALSRVPMSRVLVAGMLAFTLVSILPALHLLLIGRDLAKARLLYFPVVGVSLLLGAGIAAMRTKRQAVITAALLILFQIGMLNHNLRIWHEVSAIADRNGTDVAAAASANSSHSVVVWNVPPVLRGVQFFGNGLPEYVRHTSGLPDTSVVLRYGQVTADRRAGVLAWDPACERFEKLK
jgi:hypothetical protein